MWLVKWMSYSPNLMKSTCIPPKKLLIWENHSKVDLCIAFDKKAHPVSPGFVKFGFQPICAEYCWFHFCWLLRWLLFFRINLQLVFPPSLHWKSHHKWINPWKHLILIGAVSVSCKQSFIPAHKMYVKDTSATAPDLF